MPGNPTLLPPDSYNQALLSQVHPPDWTNPQPADCYDLLVIGAGTAGLVTAAGTAGLGLGLKVALVERYLMGGDCLNVGCVPSKCIVRSSRIAAEMRHAGAYGVMPPASVEVDFAAVMERMRRLRAEISPADSAPRLQALGVDVFFGEGQFVDAHTLKVEGQSLHFKKAVIATGARAAHPDIPGLQAVGFLTNETVFSLTERPPRLAVIGGGPIGCEMAQTFQRLGCQVILLHRSHHLLNREDAEAAEMIQRVFVREGVQLVLKASVARVERSPQGKVLHFTSDGQPGQVVVDEILVGAGRVPNVERLNLEAAGIAYDSRQGVQVNDFLQTSVPHIFACGDVCMDWKFTHAADAAARLVVKNALFAPLGLGRSRLSRLTMPWTTYTDPELAHVGLYEQEAQQRGIKTHTIRIDLAKVDRAIVDGETDGFVKVLHKAGSDKILGATIVARHAGDLISEVTLAIANNIGLSKLSGVIHPYPTQAEAIKKAADAYRRTLLTPRSQKILKLLTWFS
ncbi:MAG TPA: mercuric reductase [Synechococcales cyanobacterium M55_K2018_004]|nr:mercuric reductase [Synechococcales cyanobacterium M55_K2018_004]